MDDESEQANLQSSFKDRLKMFEKSQLLVKPPINRAEKVSHVLENKEIRSPLKGWVPNANSINSKPPIINNYQDSIKQTEVEKKTFYNCPTSRPLPVPPPLAQPPPKKIETKIQEKFPPPVQLPPKRSEINLQEINPPPIQFPPKRSDIRIQENNPPPVQLPPKRSEINLQEINPPPVQLPPKRSEINFQESNSPPVQFPSKISEVNKLPMNKPGKLNEGRNQKPPPILQPLPATLPPTVGQPPPIVQPPPKLSNVKIQQKILPPRPTGELNEIENFEKSEELKEQAISPRLQTRILSPNGDKIIHPPLPPPPPVSSKIFENLNNLTLRPPDLALPPLPPPPPSSSKTTKKTGVLVGWVKTQNAEPITNDRKIIPPDPIEKKTKCLEPTVPIIVTGSTASNVVENKNYKVEEADKPPPIVVPPPSLELVKKNRERESSPSPSIENQNSVRSSVQSSDVNNEEQYDEDEDFSSEPWFFDISREDATRLMKNCLKKGTYLIRPSQNNQYVLMVRIEANEVKKFKIQKYSNGWILGDPGKAKKIHENLSSLVNYYVTHGVKFGSVTLPLKEPIQQK